MTQATQHGGRKAARLQNILTVILALASPFAIGRQYGMIELSPGFSASVTIAILAGLPLWLILQIVNMRDRNGRPGLDPAASWIPPQIWFAYVLMAATLWGTIVYLFSLPLPFAFLIGLPMGYLAATAADKTGSNRRN